MKLKPCFCFVFFLFLYMQNGFSQTVPPTLIYAAQSSDSKFDIYDASGRKLFTNIDWAYSNIWSWIFVNNRLTKTTKVYNWKGELLIDSVEGSQSTYTNLNRVAIKKNGKWGFYDKNGKLRAPNKFSEVSHFKNDMAVVKEGTKVYAIDTNGVTINKAFDGRDYGFDDADIDLGMGGNFYDPSYPQFSIGGKTGLKDKSGNIVIPAEYDGLHDLKDQFKLVTVGRNHQYGVVRFGNEVVIPIRYSSVFVLNNYF